MQKRLTGKVALVTGARSGIGQGIAVRLAAEGACVVVADLASAEDTVSDIRCRGESAVFQQTDVRNESECRRAVETAVKQFGGIDVLVNNAGIYPRSTLEQTSEEFWDQMLGINLKGPFFLCKHAVPLMRQRGGGCIVNIGSVHGLGGAGNLFAYSVSKGGLLAMTKNLAVALARDRIRVNYLIPGWVLSQTEIDIQGQEGRDSEWLEQKRERLPMSRFQTPEDAANIVAFLASAEAVMVTGCVLNADAGYSVRCIGTENA
jgi:NAD(P)-dependent dehydrogenase (short-subunit alcohol dehydrogenase family)